MGAKYPSDRSQILTVPSPYHEKQVASLTLATFWATKIFGVSFMVSLMYRVGLDRVGNESRMHRLRLIYPPWPRFEGCIVSSVSTLAIRHVKAATRLLLYDERASVEV